MSSAATLNKNFMFITIDLIIFLSLIYSELVFLLIIIENTESAV